MIMFWSPRHKFSINTSLPLNKARAALSKALEPGRKLYPYDYVSPGQYQGIVTENGFDIRRKLGPSLYRLNVSSKFMINQGRTKIDVSLRLPRLAVVLSILCWCAVVTYKLMALGEERIFPLRVAFALVLFTLLLYVVNMLFFTYEAEQAEEFLTAVYRKAAPLH